MSEVLEFYKQQVQSGLTTIPELVDLRKKGLSDLLTRGFPTRQDEEWKYTPIDGFLQQRFERQLEVKSTQIVDSAFPIGIRLDIHNGVIAEYAELPPLPGGVIVQPLATAIEHHAEKIKPYLGKALSHEHGFHALNTAMLGLGIFVYLPAGLHLNEPIVLSHWQDQDKQAVYNRCVIIAEAGSEATIVEDFRGAEECNYFTNTITEIFIGSGTKLTHYKAQREGKHAYHMGQLAIEQASDSQFNSHSLSFGGKLVRSDIKVQLNEPRSKCLLNGIYLPNEGQHIDHHTTINHLVPHCHSEQNYKGILMGRSRAVFNGKVVVAKDAQHSEAKQQNKNLLLSSHAEIDTKPQLEIFADDVICSHGATVGQLDEEALFYLATRGISRREASSYLIHAFAADNLRLIPNPALADWMTTLLNQQLG